MITVLPTDNQMLVSSKIDNLASLGLPITYQKKIEKIIYDHRMTHELRGETCSSYEILRQRLKARGFTDVAMGVSHMLQMDAYGNGPTANTKSMKAKPIMIQKGHPKRKFA